MAKKHFYQDAKTGKIVSNDYAKKHPNTTIKHTFNTKKEKQSEELRPRQTINFLKSTYKLVVKRVSIKSLLFYFKFKS